LLQNAMHPVDHSSLANGSHWQRRGAPPPSSAHKIISSEQAAMARESFNSHDVTVQSSLMQKKTRYEGAAGGSRTIASAAPTELVELESSAPETEAGGLSMLLSTSMLVHRPREQLRQPEETQDAENIVFAEHNQGPFDLFIATETLAALIAQPLITVELRQHAQASPQLLMDVSLLHRLTAHFCIRPPTPTLALTSTPQLAGATRCPSDNVKLKYSRTDDGVHEWCIMELVRYGGEGSGEGTHFCVPHESLLAPGGYEGILQVTHADGSEPGYALLPIEGLLTKDNGCNDGGRNSLWTISVAA
jgi:hypothetical protein